MCIDFTCSILVFISHIICVRSASIYNENGSIWLQIIIILDIIYLLNLVMIADIFQLLAEVPWQ